MTARQLGELLRAGRASCVELVEDALTAAKQREDLRAFITLTETQARTEARERDRELRSGVDRGPLHGIPIAHKDLFYTRGIRTTGGSRLFEHFVPTYDADVVERLRAAGAISIGKTNLHELAFGITSRNPHFGAVLNPLDETRIPGGSSGGSAAAIAAGIVPLALGTDTGGSIRIPASYCGLVGLKPTYGVVSRRGVLPLAFSLDHVGPLTVNVEDCAFAMNAIADGEYNLPALPNFSGIRIGVARNFFFERVEDEVESQVRRAIAAAQGDGATILDVEVPDLKQAVLGARVVQHSEFAAMHFDKSDPTLFGTDVWELLEEARLVAAHDYVNAQRLRTLFRSEMDELWTKVDVLITPTTPITAPKADQVTVNIQGEEETVRMATTRLVRPVNYLGEPALSMPCGEADNGMPVGLQIISAPFTEPRLLQIAKTLERMLQR